MKTFKLRTSINTHVATSSDYGSESSSYVFNRPPNPRPWPYPGRLWPASFSRGTQSTRDPRIAQLLVPRLIKKWARPRLRRVFAFVLLMDLAYYLPQ